MIAPQMTAAQMTAPEQSRQSLLPIAAYVCTQDGADVARSVVDQTGAGEAGLKGGGLSGAARLSLDAPISDILVTEMGNLSTEDACACVREIRQSGVEVIVLGHVTDISTYRALRHSGALEYFPFPVSAADILSVQPAQPANDPGPVPLSSVNSSSALSVGVVGAAGGVGASMLARNLAFLASTSRNGPARTALIDADITFGAQAFDLDCKGTPGFIEALAAPDRVDDTFLSATMEPLSDSLFMYAHQASSAQEAMRLDAGMPDLLTPLRAGFDAVVVDMPRQMVMQQPRLVDQLSCLVVAFPAGFSGVNGVARIVNSVRQTRPDLPVFAVLSELRKDASLPQKDMAQALGASINAVLPRCDAHCAKAQNAGQPIAQCDPRAGYSKAVRALWADIAKVEGAGAAAPAPRKGLLRRVFS